MMPRACVRGRSDILGRHISNHCANKSNDGFSFVGILPTDCIGTLSDGGNTSGSCDTRLYARFNASHPMTHASNSTMSDTAKAFL